MAEMNSENENIPEYGFGDCVEHFSRIKISEEMCCDFNKKYFPEAIPIEVHDTSMERPFLVENPPFELIRVPNGKEFQKVVGPIFDDPDHIIVINGVYKIVNKYLKRQFELKAEQKRKIFKTCQERIMYHATNPNNIAGICENNFNWRLGGKSRGHKYGYGISFTPKPGFAHKFCNSAQKALFVVKVLVGPTHVGSKDMHLPREDFDTTRSPMKTVFVKFEDSEFYPEYVVLYQVIYSLGL